MGSLKRKMKRKKELALKKGARKAMKSINQQLSNSPDACGKCGISFDNTETEALDKWRVAVYDDGRVHLECPKCSHFELKEGGNL